MPREQERKTGKATGQEEETESDPGQPKASSDSAAKMSSKAAGEIDAIDEVLEEFDNLTLTELGLRGEGQADPAKVNRAIQKKISSFVQKGGQ